MSRIAFVVPLLLIAGCSGSSTGTSDAPPGYQSPSSTPSSPSDASSPDAADAATPIRTTTLTCSTALTDFDAGSYPRSYATASQTATWCNDGAMNVAVVGRCGAYDVVKVDRGTDTFTEWLYDGSSGDVVALLNVVNGGPFCIAGPSTLEVPSVSDCGLQAVFTPCE